MGTGLAAEVRRVLDQELEPRVGTRTAGLPRRSIDGFGRLLCKDYREKPVPAALDRVLAIRAAGLRMAPVGGKQTGTRAGYYFTHPI